MHTHIEIRVDNVQIHNSDCSQTPDGDSMLGANILHVIFEIYVFDS